MFNKSYGKVMTIALATVMTSSLFLAACSKSNDTSSTASPAPSSAAATQAPKGEKVDGGDVTTAYLADPQGFIRFWATTTTSSELIDLVFSSLYRFSESQDLTPDLAVGQPEFSADKLTMTIKIRNDVKFSDGTPLTADDVVFTYNIPLSDDYKGPRKSAFADVSKVEKVDEYTVKFTFKQPHAAFIDMMPYNILPSKLLKDVPVKDMDKSDFFKKPIGSGAYKLDEWKQGQYLTFSRVKDNYKKPSIEKITAKIVPDANAMMAQLQSGEINFISVPADQLGSVETYAKNNPGKIKLQKGIKASTYSFVGWNLTNPLFQDKKVRQALTMSIDRQAIIDGVAEGQGIIVNSQTPPAYWTYTDNVPKFNFNVENAKKLFAEAGWKDTNGDGILDKDGKKFEFEMQNIQGNKVRENAMTVIQQQLKKVGVQVNTRLVEGSAFTKNFQGKQFEAIYYAWNISGDPTPRGLWHTKDIEEGLNTVSYSNPEVDKLIDLDAVEFDKNKRKEYINKIDALIAEDQPYTFLYSPTVTLAYPAKLEGFSTQRDALKDVEKWYYTK